MSTPTRVAKGTHSAARHSLLDELTFNRDFDFSESTSQRPKWQVCTAEELAGICCTHLEAGGSMVLTPPASRLLPSQFHESYSGFTNERTRYHQERRLPVTMMDTFLSDSATTRQIVPDSMWRTNMMIKQNPNQRGFVTEKVTTAPFAPASHDRIPMRTSSCKLVRDQDHDLLINISTPSVFKFAPNAPLFQPMGSLPPATHAPGRPFTTHEPGRHRFFVSDVRAKLP